jgi:hypothetical protein
MAVTGMNLAEVQHLADQLRARAEQVQALVTAVDGGITHTTWLGPDAERFKNEWWPAHRRHLLDVAEHIGGLGQSAANNATEQEKASSTYGGSSAGGAHTPAPSTPPPVPAPRPEPHVPPAPADPAVTTGAVEWARSQLGDHTRVGECLGFVGDAWSSEGVNYRTQIDPAYWRGNDTYPADIWGHFTAGTTGTDPNPPAGAFVFYSGTADHPRDYSHVTLSLGDGQAISTANTRGQEIHVEPVARPGRYLGWWLPAS